MSEAAVIPPGAGEIVGDSPDRRVEILCDHDPLHATWSRFGPGREGADLHVHHRHTDCFYVLEGELTVRLGIEDRPVAVPAGTLARVPPDVVHGFRNGSDAELRYLNLHAPGQGFAELHARAARRPHARLRPARAAGGRRPPGERGVGRRRRGDRRRRDAARRRRAAGRGGAARGDGARHVHARHLEALYVLDGELEVTLGDRELRAAPGTWITVPPGVPHARAGAGRFLELHAPGAGFGAYLRGERSGFDQSAA